MHKHQEGQIWGEEGSKVCPLQCNMGPWGNQSSLARMRGTSGQAVRQLLSVFLSMAARSILSASLSAFALPADFPASVPMGQRGTPWSPIFSGEADGSAKPMILVGSTACPTSPKAAESRNRHSSRGPLLGVGTLLRDGKVWAEQMFPKMSASAVFPWFPELNKQKHPNLQGSYKNSRFSSGFKAQ